MINLQTIKCLPYDITEIQGFFKANVSKSTVYFISLIFMVIIITNSSIPVYMLALACHYMTMLNLPTSITYGNCHGKDS